MRLTTPQQNIWNLQKYYEDTAIGNICGALIYDETLDCGALKSALLWLVAAHDALRLRFSEEGGDTFQTVREPNPEEDFPVIRFEDAAGFDAYAEPLAKTPITMTDATLYRIVIAQFEGKTALLICLHHLIADAWTVSLLARHVMEAYQRLIRGEALPDIVFPPYTSFIESEEEYHKSKRYEKDKAYWRAKYDQIPPKALVRLHKEDVSPVADQFVIPVSGGLSNQIKQYSRDHHISAALLYETAMLLYLARINEEADSITIGVPVLNRATITEKQTAGMFISTVPLTVKINREGNVSDAIHAVITERNAVYRHQKYPHSEIMRDIRERQADARALYDVLVSFQNAETGIDAHTEWYSNGASEVALQFHIDQRDGEDAFRLTLCWQSEVFKNENEVRLLAERVCTILRSMVENPEGNVADLPIMSAEERKRLIVSFNDTKADYDRTATVHGLFMEQTRKHPDRIALVFHGRQFTYREIDEMSNSLAHELKKRGIGRGSVVPIISIRSWHVIVAMLGILKAGGAYMPVDPFYPSERVRYMVETAKSRVSLTLGFDDIPTEEVIRLDRFDYGSDISSLKSENQPEDNCYIIYTSGSTGTPKGVSVSHRNVVNFREDNCFFNETNNGFLSVTNIVFDIFVTESILPLLSGIAIFFADDQDIVSQKRIAELVENNPIDIIQTTPTKMRSYLLDKSNLTYLRKLKIIILGGEAFPEDLFKELQQKTDALIANIYGPSETTVWSTKKKLTGSDVITIGKPIANTQIYIIDTHLQLVPIGAAGELCIAGDGVGNGYLNRPDLTAEKFINNPFATEENGHGKIMYRTGDLARWREDGEIEYLGRIDTQVKIHGLRIELGEIESVLATFPGINLTAVTDKKDEKGLQYLVGYYTGEPADEKALRVHLGAKLPKYMIPNFFVHLCEMPMTASGKTDRKRLPVPSFERLSSDSFPPRTETEKTLASIWKELLKVTAISREDDFFFLGGDSLLAIMMITQIENKLHKTITVKDVYEYATLILLAQHLDSLNQIHETFVSKTGKKEYPLLPQQLALYSACQKNPETLIYNLPTRIHLPETVDRDRLAECVRKLPSIHPELNTRIVRKSDIVFADFSAEKQIQPDYWHDDPELYFRPFDLSDPSETLFRIAFAGNELLIDTHHIIADGHSIKTLFSDLEKLYRGEQPVPPPITFADYALYAQNLDYRADEDYFRKLLTCDFEPVVLPEKKHQTESAGISVFFNIPENIAMDIRKYQNAHRVSETAFHYAAYNLLLSQFSGSDEILSSMILRNRPFVETDTVVGMFVNTLPTFTKIEGSTSNYIKRTQDIILEMMAHQEIPFLKIAKAVNMPDKKIINNLFVFQGDGLLRSFVLNDITCSASWVETYTSKFDLTFEVTPTIDGYQLRIEYDTGKYDASLIDHLYSGYLRILKALCIDQDVHKISVLSSEERSRIIESFNDTKIDYNKEVTVHELFAEQVRTTPERVALVFHGHEFTYQELDEMSNSLANDLRLHGIQRFSKVPIISTRSWHMIVAALAVIKAGGTYIPIDPAYPEDRIEYMLSVVHASLILVYGYKKTGSLPYIDLEEFDFRQNTEALLNINSASDDCYMIFTSGSSGMPKGVIIQHKNVVNFANDNSLNVCHRIIKPQKRCILCLSSFSFDMSITETLLPLINGLTIYLADDAESVNPRILSRNIGKNTIDIIESTPTKLSLFFESDTSIELLKHASAIIVGGEALIPDFLDKLKSINTNIYNNYGPAETTVWSSIKEQSDDDITIGTPISNTQIYILDSHESIVPIGVAGELCIAGDGVGAGYLNRPDLTADKFVPNPFATEENDHGKIMYRTGDLARWREDGEIEFLGRIDTQVKIRGLRIELGEIESVMATFTGIQLTAAADKKDENGRQYLVGYYTGEPADEKALRAHLAAKLPKYMIPNFFVHLKEMPMTTSGKTDRKRLPAPSFGSVSDAYVPPETQTQKELCDILSEVLNQDRVGVEDDFFTLGGDSLSALLYSARAADRELRFSIQDVYNYPTVRALSACLEGSVAEKTAYIPEDCERYEPLLARNRTDPDFEPVKKPLGDVLLTGATGFLGAHILDALMREETGRIYCLVRGRNTGDAEARLRERLAWYFDGAYDGEIGNRIHVICGDVTREGLADSLPGDIRTVIHAAASVKHYGNFEYFHGINTLGTRNVADFALRCSARMIHISTGSVSGNSMADDFSVYRSPEEKTFDETCLYIGQPLNNVYVRSKFEAERCVLDAMLNGLDAVIIRVGNLTNRVRDFRFQPNYRENAFLTRVKAVLELGKFPDYLLPLYAEFSPVDLTAEGVLRIAQYTAGQTVFHLFSDRPLAFPHMLELLAEMGITMEVLEGEAFGKALKSTLKDRQTEYIYEAFQRDLDERGRLMYDTNIHLDNRFTHEFLGKTGFRWNEIDLEYLKGYIGYFRKLGFFRI